MFNIMSPAPASLDLYGDLLFPNRNCRLRTCAQQVGNSMHSNDRNFEREKREPLAE